MRGIVRLGVAAVLLVCAVQLHAQVTTGTISGKVADSTGAVLAGATVAILNDDTGVSRTVNTDSAGRYIAPSLPLGNYRVTVSQEGFQTQVRSGIVLMLGREAVVNLELPVGAVTQTVEVIGQAPLVETTGATVGFVVDDRTIRDLPLNGRDLTELILMNPGVSQATFAASNNVYTGFGRKFSISGFRAEDNAYFLDGTYINDYSRHIPAGPSGALMGAETVREFEVLTNSYGARYGRALGGVFNAVSRAGTNAWEASVYEYLRNSALDARDFFDRKQRLDDPRLPVFRRNQFGATAGGPLLHDRTFFFVNYEELRESLGLTNYRIVPDIASRTGNLPGGRKVQVSPAITAYLNYPIFPAPSPGGLSFPTDGTAQFIFQDNQPSWERFGQARIDHQFSVNDSLFGRFTGSGAELAQIGNFPEFRTILAMNTRLATLSETHIFSNRALSTSRFSLNRVTPQLGGKYPQVPAQLLSVPGQPPPGLTPGGGITAWAGAPQPTSWFITNRFNFAEDADLTLGPHSLQFGGMFERTQLNESNPNRSQGDWSFASLEQFLLGTPRQYRGTPPQFGTSVRGFRQRFFAACFQDNWRLKPGFTLNLGVRWEPYTTPTEVNGLIANLRSISDTKTTVGAPYWLNKSWGDFGPRFGFAWTPSASGKTSVRGGVGLFFAPVDTLYYFPATTRIVPLLPEFILVNPKHFPDALAEIAAAEIPNGSVSGMSYSNMVSTRALQYNLTVEQQVGASTVISAGFTGNRGIHVLSFANYNAPLARFNGTALELPRGATLLNRAFQDITMTSSGADSRYNGISVALRRRFSRGLQTQVSYTVSRAISNSDTYARVDRSGSGPGITRYAHDLNVDKALSGYHIANKLSLNYSYNLPLGQNWRGIGGAVLGGWQLTGIVTVQSGQPFTVSDASGATPTALSNLGYARYPNVDTTFPKDRVILGGPDKYFNPLAFYLPAGDFELGNVGRNTLLGPGLSKWDMALNKEIHLPLNEKARLQFRGEFFNMLNHPNFGKPDANVFTANRQRAATAGLITNTVTTSRQIQFGLKIMF